MSGGFSEIRHRLRLQEDRGDRLETELYRLIARVNELEDKQRQDENYADEQRERAG